MARDYDSLLYQKNKYYDVRPGKRESEIKCSINDKIAEIDRRILDKQRKLDSLKDTIYELKSKL